MILANPRAWAEEPVLEFLHAAQEHGYGEVSVDYLEQLQREKRLPKSLVETFDLELSRSYRVAVAEAFNAAEAQDRLARAQSHLDAFLKQHPEHPEVARAMESWGDIGLDRALERIRQAAGLNDKAAKEKLLAAARADLEGARPRFTDATARYLARYTQLKQALRPDNGKRTKTVPNAKKQRQAEEAARDAEINWLECRFKSAKIDYYTAQTYLDPKAPERSAALQAAAKAFDNIFQAYRENLVGLHAHMWHGRAADALADDQLALDIYDEVLSISPDTRERDTGLEPLFAQVQYLRLLVLARKEGTDDLLAEATPWLQQHRNWRKFDGYQGVALEVAKAHLKSAAALTGQKRTSQIQSALAMLSDVSKVRGEHQQEAILLHRQQTKGTGEAADLSTVKTFDEALALGEAATENQDWPAAVAAISKALELRSTEKNSARITATESRLDHARCQVAQAQYAEGKFAECLTAAEQILHDRPAGSSSAAASSLAVSAALSLYLQAEDKPAALGRLEQVAQEIIARVPDKAEADDARIALGQACLVRNELPAAIEVFERVNPRSLRYPSAMFLAGQTHWRQYLATRAKTAAAPTGDQPERTKAEEQLLMSLQGQQKEAEAGKPPSRQLFETQLLLGEIRIDAGQAAPAVEMLDPLVERIKVDKPETVDNLLLRLFLAAVRARIAAGQDQQAIAAAMQLGELAPDSPVVNGVLGSMLKLFTDSWKQSEAAVIDARTAGDATRRSAAEAAAKSRRDLAAALTAQLAKRKEHSLPALIAIADNSAQLEQPDTARELYQRVLTQAESDAQFQKTHAAALTRIQAQLVGLLRQKGQYAEGIKEVDRLIAAHPNALEPKMEKGRLLQGWAETDPSHFKEAVAHWTMLRTRLATMAKKPPEYYEVVFNAAWCLFLEGAKANDKQKALQAEQLLNATLVLSPRLSGPEMVARYKELLHKARVLQGRAS